MREAAFKNQETKYKEIISKPSIKRNKFLRKSFRVGQQQRDRQRKLGEHKFEHVLVACHAHLPPMARPLIMWRQMNAINCQRILKVFTTTAFAIDCSINLIEKVYAKIEMP